MITKEQLNAYREAAKKIGIWDESYSTIKKNMTSILHNIRRNDYALDILGCTIEQMILMARLIVYGTSDDELSNETLEVLFSPMEPLESLMNTPYVLNAGVDAATGILPLAFKVMHMSKDINEFKNGMRRVMVLPTKINSSALAHGIAYNICFRKYPGMDKYFDVLIDKLDKMVDRSGYSKELSDKVDALSHGSDVIAKAFKFTALFAMAVTNCNLQDSITTDKMHAFMDYIHEIARQNEKMYEFISSRGFPTLVHSIEHINDD